jgi:Sugar phosphate permease
MFGFLKPAPDAEQKISEEKVPRLYKMWQTRVLISTAIVYIGYYIIRLIFTVQQNDISKAYGFRWDKLGQFSPCLGLAMGFQS